MRLAIACALLIGATLPAATSAAYAAGLPPVATHSSDFVAKIASKKQPPSRDCTPYNGPFGFYGNIWCQPPSEMSYLRNLGSPWPMKTPPALKKSKPDTSTDW